MAIALRNRLRAWVRRRAPALGHRVRARLGAHPRAFHLAYRTLGGRPEWLVTRDTEIVIEGFPRSANTRALYAFLIAQGRPVRTADHLHSPAQVLLGLGFSKPVLVLVRRPEDAVRSLLVRDPGLTVRDGLEGYVAFYEPLVPVRDRIVVATFEQVIGDFGGVLNRINAHYGTSFRPYTSTQENEARVALALEHRHGGVPPLASYTPHPAKEALKARVRLADPGALAAAQKLHRLFRAIAEGGQP